MSVEPLRLLATDMAWEVIHGAVPAVQERLMALPPQQVCISPMTRTELTFGLLELKRAQWGQRITEILKTVQTVPWDAAAADKYAELGFEARQSGADPGDKDVAIAAHALTAGAVLVTAKPNTFRSISTSLALETRSAH